MKHSGIWIFLSIVLLIYSGINFYIYKRGIQALPGQGSYRTVFTIVFLIFVLAYPLGRIAERTLLNGFSRTLVSAGSFYLGFMVYAFLIILLIDLFRLVNYFIPYFPKSFSQNPVKTGWITFITVFAVVAGIGYAGYLNAIHPRIRTLNLNIQKSAGPLKKLNIVMASDIHLGTIVHNSRLEHIVDTINSLQPDLVLLPGDILDEDVAPVAAQNMNVTLQNIHSKFGVFAVTGNHEYFGGVKAAVEYIQGSDIQVLQDSAVLIDNAFYVIGRKDLTSNRMADGRKPLGEIVGDLKPDMPKILMDHQPFHLEEAQQNAVDLQLSGHTHHGQLFPFNLITKKVYEVSWGYLQKGQTQYYVSCGVGTWGPPMRLGNRPEIVQIHITFGGDGDLTAK